MPWSWSILGDLFGDLFSAGCLRGPWRACWCYTGPNPRLDQRRKLIHYDVVSSSHTLEFGKTTPNSSSASNTTPREVDSIPIPIRPRPTSGRPFFFSGRLRNTPSRGRVVKISNTPSCYYSCRVRIWIIWWWGDVNLTSATLSAILGGPSETISSSSHRLILRFLAY